MSLVASRHQKPSLLIRHLNEIFVTNSHLKNHKNEISSMTLTIDSGRKSVVLRAITIKHFCISLKVHKSTETAITRHYFFTDPR